MTSRETFRGSYSPFFLGLYAALGLSAFTAACDTGDIGAADIVQESACLAEATDEVPDGFETVFVLQSANGLLCTATAIDANTLITAAHCVEDSPDRLLLQTGVAADLCAVNADPCAPVDVAVALHPTADIALVHTTAPLRFGANVKKFPAFSQQGDFTTFEFVGYGEGYYVSDGGHCDVNAGDRLLYGFFEIDVREETYFGAFSERYIPNVCAGDSGGPAIVRGSDGMSLVGILSFAYTYPDDTPCTPENGLQVWSSLAPYLDWIETTRDAWTPLS